VVVAQQDAALNSGTVTPAPGAYSPIGGAFVRATSGSHRVGKSTFGSSNREFLRTVSRCDCLIGNSYCVFLRTVNPHVVRIYHAVDV
jgi:hypothetical protein